MQAFLERAHAFRIACALFFQSSLFLRIDYRSVEIRYFLFYIECFCRLHLCNCILDRNFVLFYRKYFYPDQLFGHPARVL